MKDKTNLEGNYGYILARCENNFDLAQDVCVFMLENKLDVSRDTIDKTIETIRQFKKRIDRQHEMSLEQLLENIKEASEGLDRLDKTTQGCRVPVPVAFDICGEDLAALFSLMDLL